MAAKGLFINSTEQGFTVRGRNNNFFPDNATLAYPANSVILITDESDMAIFRSASNYDVLFSALIKDININGERVTKDNIIETFNEAANQSSGGGGDITGLFASVSYDSDTKHINFYDTDKTLVDYVDATNFIKDGMVSNVEISNGNLVITFNTDAGKEPITIPLTDIFNPANYYDKTTADSTFATQVVVNEEIAARIAGDGALNTALQSKADKSDTYTKSQVDALIPDTSNFVTKAEYNPKEVAIAEALTDLNENKADKAELNGKQDTLTAGTGISIQNNVISASGGGGGDYQFYNEIVDPETNAQTAQIKNTYDDGKGVVKTSLVLTNVDEGGEPYVDINAQKDANKGKENYSKNADVFLGPEDGVQLFYQHNDNSEETSIESHLYVDGNGLELYASESANSETVETFMMVTKDGITINNERVLTESDGAYYISFATIATTGIRDEDWDGIVAAIDAHRPIYAGYPRQDGSILYYGVECMDKNVSNTQIVMTTSDDNQHYFYTFVKNGSNDYSYTVETRPYTTAAEKTAWNAKQDALVSGTNIKTINNESILGEGNIEIQGGGGGMDEDTELLISSALVDLNDRKIDATEVKENYQKKGDYATNAKVDTKANISDVPTNTDYEEAQKITSWSLNDLNARFGGVRLQIITQSDYEALATKDNNTLYVITTN